jgi:hypothetical protein
MTPIEACIRVNLGRPVPELVASLQGKNFEFAPISGIQGVVSVRHLQYLLEFGLPLLPDDPKVQKTLVDESIDLEQLLETIARENPVLVIHKDEVIGLLTLSDLNKHALRSVLYSRFASFEMELAALISRLCPNHLEWIDKLREDSQVKILGHWAQSQRKNVGVGPIVACTLTDLLHVVQSTKKIRDVFGLKSQKVAEDESGSLPSLRNSVMHPVKPLVTKSEDAERMVRSLRKMQRLAEALKNETFTYTAS